MRVIQNTDNPTRQQVLIAGKTANRAFHATSVQAASEGRALASVLFAAKKQADAAQPEPKVLAAPAKTTSIWQTLNDAKVVFASIILSWLPIKSIRAGLEQTHLYTPIKGASPDKLVSSEIKARLTDEYFTSADGTRLNGWFVKADPEAAREKGPRPVVLFAHGRACNLNDCESVIELFTKNGFDIFVFDYRGYGNSDGKPSEEGLYQDLEAASRFLTRRYGVESRNQLAVGSSLGGGVLANVAQRIPFKAVAITASFTSMDDAIAQRINRFSPGLRRFLAKDAAISKFNSLESIQRCLSPVFIAGAVNDDATPLWMSKALHQAAPSHLPKGFLALTGCEHHEVYEKAPEQLMAGLESFLSELESKRPLQPVG